MTVKKTIVFDEFHILDVCRVLKEGLKNLKGVYLYRGLKASLLRQIEKLEKFNEVSEKVGSEVRL